MTTDLDERLERAIKTDPGLDSTTRKGLIQARRGQGAYRRAVENVDRRCRLTGVENPALLIASHLKPWRACGTVLERLDGMNGLMLTPDADLLVDRGFVSFADDGAVLISPRVARADLRRLGFERLTRDQFDEDEPPATWNVGAFLPGQQPYLAYHRADVFIA